MINTQNFQLCLLIKSMFCCLVLRRGCLLEKPNFVVADHHHHAADHHHHVEQDVWGGYYMLQKFPTMCVCVFWFYLSNPFLYII